MKLLDWFASIGQTGRQERERKALSRRDFFASVTGRRMGRPPVVRAPLEPPVTRPAAAQGSFTPSPDALHTFYVADFPSDRSRKLLTLMRPGLVLHLRREKENADDPHAVRIDWGRSYVGYVPADLSPEIAALVQADTPPRCVVAAIDPAAHPPYVLRVELSPFIP